MIDLLIVCVVGIELITHFFCALHIHDRARPAMYGKARRVVNRNLAATSTVRLIEAYVQPTEEQSARIILKPKEVKKQLPGTKLLIKLAKAREHEKIRRKIERALAQADEPEIDEAAVDEAVEDIFEALEI